MKRKKNIKRRLEQRLSLSLKAKAKRSWCKSLLTFRQSNFSLSHSLPPLNNSALFFRYVEVNATKWSRIFACLWSAWAIQIQYLSCLSPSLGRTLSQVDVTDDVVDSAHFHEYIMYSIQLFVRSSRLFWLNLLCVPALHMFSRIYMYSTRSVYWYGLEIYFSLKHCMAAERTGNRGHVVVAYIIFRYFFSSGWVGSKPIENRQSSRSFFFVHCGEWHFM